MGTDDGKPARRILVVDDETSLLEVASEVLTDAGYRVTASRNGREAVAALRSIAYDAVLSDIRMPDLDGLSLLRVARGIDPDLPVILLTGGPSIETAIQAVASGALEYLTKPLSIDKLLQVVERAVRLGELARLKRQALIVTGHAALVGDQADLEVVFERGIRSLWMACQPIVVATDHHLYAHEMLLRTDEPAFPNPGALILAAERLGRVPEVGRAVRASVAGLLASGMLPGQVFVNLHPLELLDPALLDPTAPLSRFASRVVLEVTERSSLQKVTDAAERIRGLRRLGYRIAVDDLGAGYAGLSTFVALTPEVVKLDMSLIRGLDVHTIKQKLVGSMTRLCAELGSLVIAEGIETEQERDAAVAAGCDLLQGFLFGRPGRLATAGTGTAKPEPSPIEDRDHVR